jgi:hypothetical protein
MNRDILPRLSKGRRIGCLASIFGALLFGVAVIYAVAAITSPWSFHIGGRWTPFLSWSGYGTLVTKNGTYPLYISFYPSSHFSRLHLDGLRPTGGLQGNGWLCTAPGTIERLSLSGTIYNGWSTTEGSLMGFRLNERNAIDLGQHRGYFDLYGRWQGLQLVMDDRGGYSTTFRSGLRPEHASVTFDWGSYSDFKPMCASAKLTPPHP